MTKPQGSTLQSLSSLYLEEYLGKIRHCVGLLTDEEAWWRPAPDTNSTANLLLHLTGNLSLWVLNALGGEANPRHRSAEFAADHTVAKDMALAGLEDVVSRCRRVIDRLSDVELDRALDIQGYETDGRGALFHAVEHMSYHTGQIVWITKQVVAGRATIEFYPQHSGE